MSKAKPAAEMPADQIPAIEALPEKAPPRKASPKKVPSRKAPPKKAPSRPEPEATPQPEPAAQPQAASPATTRPRSRKPVASNSLAALTEGVIEALAAAGGADYLLTIARDDPKTFCALLTRILPGRTEGKADSGVKLRWDMPARKGSSE